MSSAITNAGEALLALKQNQEAALVIDTFILANVADIDPAADVDRTGGKPDAGDIVLEYTIPGENKGYINPNQVVYSMLLGSDIGDFTFNWVGLYSSADDTVVAVAYTPELSKWKTAHPVMGNALTRNFMLEYSGIKNTTQITVEASTWQIDFTARLKGIDERERLSNRDIYGGACFFGDGYLVANDAGTFKLQPGLGYVEGIRIEQAAEQILAPALPAEVFLDVALQPQGSDRVAVAQVVYADPGDYVDGTNDKHFGQKIAEIADDGTVVDFRPKTMGGELSGLVAGKNHTHVTGDITNLVEFPLTIDESGNVAWDPSAHPNTVLTLTTDATIAAPANMAAGGIYTVRVQQDATGGRTLTWAAAYIGDIPDMPTATAAERVYRYYCTGAQLISLAADIEGVLRTTGYEEGDIIIGNADGELERLALPSNGKILGSVDGRPAWVDMPEFISAALGGIPTHSAEFTTDGTWSAPAALLDGLAVVEVQAGGCYGKAAYNYLDAQNSPTPVGPGGGGSGRYFFGLVPVAAGTDYAVTVGVGGDYSSTTPAGSSSFADLVSCPAAPASNSAGLASIDASVFALFSHAASGQPGGIGGIVGMGGSAPHGGGGANSSGSGYGAGGSGANDGAPGRVRIWWNQRS